MRRVLKAILSLVFLFILFFNILSPTFAEELQYLNGPQFIVVVPKYIDLNIDKTFNYEVIITGEIDKYTAISVVPDEEFFMIEQSNVINKKDDVTASVVQNKTVWTIDNLNENAKGIITAPGLTAGVWNGYFNFNISIHEREIDYNLFILTRNNYAEVGIEKLSGDIQIPFRFEKNDDFYKVSGIESYMFSDCHTLNSVVIPNSVNILNEGLFKNCYSFTKVVISNTVTEICKDVFYNCHNLNNVIIPESVTKIDDRAFYGCYSLSNIILSNNITYIGKEAFYECHNIESITLPDNISYIGDNAFYNFYSLKNVIYKENVYTNLNNLHNELRKNNVIFNNNIFINTQLSN